MTTSCEFNHPHHTEIPEAPTKALFPKCFQGEHVEFTYATTKVLQTIEAQPSHQRKQLRVFVQSVLYPGVPEDRAPAIPTSPKKLMDHVLQYCDPLNIGTLQMLSKHLKNDYLTRQLEDYERTLSDQLEQATWDIQVDVTPPPAYKIILIKLEKPDNTTVREAVEVRDILAENLMFKGDHGILHLAGLANDSLVFFVADGNVGPMARRMLHKREKMVAAGVDVVTFVKLANVDVARGEIIPDPNVSVPVQHHQAYACYTGCFESLGSI